LFAQELKCSALKFMKLISFFALLAALHYGPGLWAQDLGGAPGFPGQPSFSHSSLSLTPDEKAAKGEAEGGGGGGNDDKSTEALAKATQNPVSDLISVPFQNNFNFGVGPNRVMQYILNFQPVIPITLNEEWNLITRTILPTINQPSPAPGIRSAFGLGDLNPSLFLSPNKQSGLIWGVGPTFTLPTATDPLLGSGKWSAGPTVVVLTTQGHWVGGALANNQWSFAGWGPRSVNQMLIQPFVNYNFPKGWYVTFSPIITANWKADSDNRWTVPVGGGLGRIVKWGKQPINLQLSGFYNVERPEDLGARWQLRAQVQLLFPKKEASGEKEKSQ
jgi:hypothetical protein